MYDDHPEFREDRKNRQKFGEPAKGDTRRSRSNSRPRHDRPPRRSPSGERRHYKPSTRRSRSREYDRNRERPRGGERGHDRERDRGDHRHHRSRHEEDDRRDPRDHHGSSRRGEDRQYRAAPDNGHGQRAPDEAKLGRQTSEERRAMIAKWQEEDDRKAN